MQNLILHQIPDDFTHYVKIYQNEKDWCKIYINQGLYLITNDENLLRTIQPERIEECIVYYVEILMILLNGISQFQINSYPYQIINNMILEIRKFLKDNEKYIYDASLICGNVNFYYENFENKKFKINLLRIQRENQIMKMELEEFRDKFLKQKIYFQKEIGNLIKNINYLKPKTKEIGIQTISFEKNFQENEVQTFYENKDIETQVLLDINHQEVQCNLKDELERKYQELFHENKILRENIKELKNENKSVKKLKKELELIEKKKDKEIENVIKQKDKEKNEIVEKSIKMTSGELEKRIVSELRNTALTAHDLFQIINNNQTEAVCHALNVWFFLINANKATMDYHSCLMGEKIPNFEKFWLEYVLPDISKHISHTTFSILKNEWDNIHESFLNVNGILLQNSINIIFYVHCLRMKSGTYSHLSLIPPFFSALFSQCGNILKALEIVKYFTNNHEKMTKDEIKELSKSFLKLFIVRTPFEICYQNRNDPLLAKLPCMKILFDNI